jgi:hypothetical protein
VGRLEVGALVQDRDGLATGMTYCFPILVRLVLADFCSSPDPRNRSVNQRLFRVAASQQNRSGVTMSVTMTTPRPIRGDRRSPTVPGPYR